MVPVVRKYAHYSIYLMLGIVTINYMLTYRGRSFYQKGLTSFLFCVFYSITDEIHQVFVSGRTGQIKDIVIDTIGVAIGVVFLCIVMHRRILNEEKKEEEI